MSVRMRGSSQSDHGLPPPDICVFDFYCSRIRTSTIVQVEQVQRLTTKLSDEMDDRDPRCSWVSPDCRTGFRSTHTHRKEDCTPVDRGKQLREKYEVENERKFEKARGKRGCDCSREHFWIHIVGILSAIYHTDYFQHRAFRRSTT